MKLLLPFLLLIFFAGCKKIYIEKIIEVEVEKKYTWTELKDLGLSFSDKVQKNIISINDSIIVLINNDVIQQYNSKTLKRNDQGNAYYGFGNVAIGEKPYLSKKIFIGTSSGYSKINFTSEPANNYINAFLNTGYSNDTNFLAFKGCFIKSCTYPAVVNDKYILYPIRHKNDSTVKQHLYVTRLKDTILSGQNALKIDKIQTVSLSPSVGTSFLNSTEVYSINTKFGKFFVSTNDNFYRIDTLGNVKSFGAPIYNVTGIFTINNLLFAINPNGRIYISQDQGETFSLFSDMGSTSLGFLGFTEINNTVIAYYNDQIWNITLSGNELKFKELKNDGLEGHKITAIANCGTKYFTTTLSGVFYRDSTNMFLPK
jgi:hypothetical protein